MFFLLIVFVIIAIVAAAIFTLRGVSAKSKSKSISHHLYKAKLPLSAPEQTLYWRFREALPECEILAQVAFSRFLEPVQKGSTAARSSIAQKTVDFLVVLKSLDIVAAVELDDSSHKSKRSTNAQRDAVLLSAGIKTVRYHVASMPTAEQIKSDFMWFFNEVRAIFINCFNLT